MSEGLRSAPYVFDDRDFVLSDASATIHGPNIGTDGRDLTISFLTLNRVSLSIRLLDSIAREIRGFAGEVLIGDNGSDANDLAELKAYLASFPYRWRLLEFGKNYGVAGGRNRIMAEAGTDWVISLDNDIYFVANPLSRIQEELATLGCRFMSFPLMNPDRKTLFARGACLRVAIQDAQPRLTINPIDAGCIPAEASAGSGAGFLSTFLFGGASILSKTSFERLGGFDAGMFIGFEDIDFSLRLFREGMKIGTSGQIFLVHDHPKAESQTDAEYERARYSRKTLYQSARYLENKTGFKIWGAEVESWMRTSEHKQGFLAAENAATRESSAPHARRPRVALITDTDDWAFANISRQLVRHLSDEFDFEIIPLVTVAEIERRRWLAANCPGEYAEGGATGFGLALVAAAEFDIVHVFWREFLMLVDTPLLEDYAKRVGLSAREFHRRYIDEQIISTSVYDHLFIEPEAMTSRARIFNEIANGYYVSSERLKRIYDEVGTIPRPMAVLPDGVDLELFKPRNLERFEKMSGRPIRIGWVGHSGWASTLEDFKGVNTILIPAIDRLQGEGLAFTAEFADRKVRQIAHSDMPAYYGTIDVLVCTSKIEGTPNPVLEAMACGVPIVTTDVGIVGEALGEKQKAFVLPERSVEALMAALRRLHECRGLFAELSSENIVSIQAWDWSKRAKPFADYFRQLLAGKHLRTGELRTKACMLPFTSPSMEPDGNIRLCSASSIFAYYDETEMGNVLNEGLEQVWHGQRYRDVRRPLMTGRGLKPYCQACEYRFDAPSWLLQLHLALHAWHSHVRAPGILALIGRRADRYAEYERIAPALNLTVYPLSADLRGEALAALAAQEADQSISLIDKLAPAELVAGVKTCRSTWISTRSIAATSPASCVRRRCATICRERSATPTTG